DIFHCVFYAFADTLIFFYTATTAIYTLSLHDALPISRQDRVLDRRPRAPGDPRRTPGDSQDRALARAHEAGADVPRCASAADRRSEEHTSELQSLAYLVCRLLLEKKKKYTRLSNA